MILDPWDPLVMWNDDDDDDDDGDDHIKNPSANLPCADNLSRHHLDHNSYLKKSTNSVLFRRPPFLLHYAAGLCWFQVRGGVPAGISINQLHSATRKGDRMENVFGERLVL